MMKISKEQEKELCKAFKPVFRKHNYKTRLGRYFSKQGNSFIIVLMSIMKHEIIDYRIEIKEYVYDDIFWKIMQMPENSEEPDSLRAVGAFRAPSMLIKQGQLDITEKYEELAELFISDIEKSVQEFIEQYNLDDYALNNAKGWNNKTLRCLAYIHQGKIYEAKKLAQYYIDCGDEGGFKNAGKFFFEWLLLMDDNSLLHYNNC